MHFERQCSNKITPLLNMILEFNLSSEQNNTQLYVLSKSLSSIAVKRVGPIKRTSTDKKSYIKNNYA